jgi:hypothetical protein
MWTSAPKGLTTALGPASTPWERSAAWIGSPSAADWDTDTTQRNESVKVRILQLLSVSDLN